MHLQTFSCPRRRKAAHNDRIADATGAAEAPARHTDHIATDAAFGWPDRVAGTAADAVDRVADIDRVADDTGDVATKDPLRSQPSASSSIFVPRRRKVAQSDRLADVGGAAQGHRVAEACPAEEKHDIAVAANGVEPDRVADTMAAPVDRVADEDVTDGEATDLDLDSVSSWDSNDSVSTNDIDEGPRCGNTFPVEDAGRRRTRCHQESGDKHPCKTFAATSIGPVLKRSRRQHVRRGVSNDPLRHPWVHLVFGHTTVRSELYQKPNVDTERLEMDTSRQNMLFRCIPLSVGTSAKQPCQSVRRL